MLRLLQRAEPLLRCRVANTAGTALQQLRAHPDTNLVLSDLRLGTAGRPRLQRRRRFRVPGSASKG